MPAEILTIGTEILLGQIVDTNAAYVAERLAEAGIDVYQKTTVGDNLGRVASAFREALGRADIIIATGGLGPTEDDLTREAVADVLGLKLVEDPEILQGIQKRFAARGLTMTENNRKQAQVPKGAEVLDNPRGTAPGLYVPAGEGKVIVLMPGVPSEMRPMLTEQVIPRLRDAFGIRARIVSRVLKTCGIAESKVDAAINDLFRTQRNPSIALLAHAGEIHIRLTAKADSPEAIAGMLDDLEARIRQRLGPLVFGRDAERLEDVLGGILRARGERLAVAESCTGGLIAHRLTNVPGSSDYFEGGVVAYSNAAKAAVLGVPETLMARHGSVSREVAEAMAHGVRHLARSHYGLATTGIMGPGGATPGKPVGLVHIALNWEGGGLARHYRFLADRETNKVRVAQMALELLRRHLLGLDGGEA